MNPSFIVYSFLEMFSTKWNAYPSLLRQNKICLLKTLMQTVIKTFLNIFYLLMYETNWYLLTSAINATCKNSNYQRYLLK